MACEQALSHVTLTQFLLGPSYQPQSDPSRQSLFAGYNGQSIILFRDAVFFNVNFLLIISPPSPIITHKHLIGISRKLLAHQKLLLTKSPEVRAFLLSEYNFVSQDTGTCFNNFHAKSLNYFSSTISSEETSIFGFAWNQKTRYLITYIFF